MKTVRKVLERCKARAKCRTIDEFNSDEFNWN